MKKTIISALVAVLAFTSCDLDVYPEDKLVNDQALLTMSDLAKFEVGTYAAFRSNFQPDMIVAGDMQGDYVNAVRAFGNTYGPLHNWTFSYTDYEVRDVWNACYFTIAQTNYVLSKAETISYEADEQADFDTIMGEMYFFRAMSLFQLVEKFCGDYRPSTATAANSGLPILTDFDPQYMPSRSTLEETYTRILQDIAEAKQRLSGIAGSVNSNLVTIDCVTALEARIYLQMHDYETAYAKASSLIGGKYALAATADALKGIFANDKGSEVIFVFYASKTELAPDYATQFVLDQNSRDDYYKPQYIPTQTLVDLYDDADHRKSAFFIKAENGTCEIAGTKIATPVYLMNKYPGNTALQTTAGTKNYRNAFKVFRVAEMYLIAAEAATQIPGSDAKTPLNALRTSRGIAALDAVTLADVKAERKRELMFEGGRIADLKRWGDDLDARTPQTGKNDLGESVVLHEAGDSYDKLSVKAGDYRFVWPIPADEIYANQNLASQQNPGWEK